jgi:hypothetical protein
VFAEGSILDQSRDQSVEALVFLLCMSKVLAVFAVIKHTMWPNEAIESEKPLKPLQRPGFVEDKGSSQCSSS